MATLGMSPSTAALPEIGGDAFAGLDEAKAEAAAATLLDGYAPLTTHLIVPCCNAITGTTA